MREKDAPGRGQFALSLVTHTLLSVLALRQ